MRKIYDCFPFFNEFDILEIRLQELWDHVDYFVISEANTTHRGNPKPFYLLDNFERFKPYKDKIVHVPVTDMPGFHNGDYWPNERHQRDCLVRGLTNVTAEDVIMISDVDELIRGECAAAIRTDFDHYLWAFRMPTFHYRFNYMWTTPLIFQVQGQALIAEQAAKLPTFSYTRDPLGFIWVNRAKNYDADGQKCFVHAGWHFTNMGSSDHIAHKLTQFAHNPEDEAVRKTMAENFDVDEIIARREGSLVPGSKFDIVKLDEYFPKFILDNKDRFAKLILADGEKSASEILSIIPLDSNLQY